MGNFDIDLDFGQVYEQKIKDLFEGDGSIEVKPEGVIWADTGKGTMYISKGGYWHPIGDIQQVIGEEPQLTWWQRIAARIRSLFR